MQFLLSLQCFCRLLNKNTPVCYGKLDTEVLLWLKIIFKFAYTKDMTMMIIIYNLYVIMLLLSLWKNNF